MKKLAILIADLDELNGLLPFLRQNQAVSLKTPFPAAYEMTCGGVPCLVLCCGIGKVDAAAGTMFVLTQGCDTVFNYGYSGGLSGVAKGQLFVVESTAEHDFDLTPIGCAPGQHLGESPVMKTDAALCARLKELFPQAACGLALTGDCFVSSDERRACLCETFGGHTCDMETAAMARVCAKANVPFASLRVVSDNAGEEAESMYRESLQTDRSLNEVAALAIRALCEGTV